MSLRNERGSYGRSVRTSSFRVNEMFGVRMRAEFSRLKVNSENLRAVSILISSRHAALDHADEWG
jgi:hypothetical protein